MRWYRIRAWYWSLPKFLYQCQYWEGKNGIGTSPIFDQINTDILFRRVNYPYLTTSTSPIVFLYPVSTWIAVTGLQNAVWDLLKYTHGGILTSVEDGAISAYSEKSQKGQYGPLSDTSDWHVPVLYSCMPNCSWWRPRWEMSSVNTSQPDRSLNRHRLNSAHSIDGYKFSPAHRIRRHRLSSAHSMDGYRLNPDHNTDRPKLMSSHSIDRHSSLRLSPTYIASRRLSHWLSPEDSLDRNKLSPSYVPDRSVLKRPASFRTASRQLRRQVCNYHLHSSLHWTTILQLLTDTIWQRKTYLQVLTSSG